MYTTGTRLESQVCDTQVIVVRTAESLADLRCGGAAMVEIGGERSGAALDGRFAEGTALGKRYVDETGAEILVTKAGAGSLSVGDARLRFKESTALPSSD
ncbi:hypothetical protein [Rhodococcus gannanensis]|uniref:Uncharacterized protein n=1 Tax=Rhodococcus gannanensis TaxID=1960308 RepID=A0ABW4P4W1_9NOCA